jgi:hypothetical protein
VAEQRAATLPRPTETGSGSFEGQQNPSMPLVAHMGLQRDDPEVAPRQAELTDHGQRLHRAIQQTDHEIGLNLALQVCTGP